jgi:hypothetical protein
MSDSTNPAAAMVERCCETCGQPLATTSATARDCQTCEQWWKNNPPPAAATSDGLAEPWQAVRNQCVESLFWHDEAGWRARTEALTTILAALRPAQPAAVEVEALVALDELDGSDFEAIHTHSKTLRAALSAIAAERDAMRKALEAIMELPGELNMSNYNDDDVATLNASHIEAYNISRAALTSSDGGRK